MPEKNDPSTRIRRIRMFSLLVFFLCASCPAWGQLQDPDSASETALILTGTLTALLAAFIFFVIFVLREDVEPLFALVRSAWAYVVPRASEQTIPMDENFDDISELDNRIPPWFNYLFGGTILFAVLYLLDYHVWNASPLPQAEYAQEMAAADLARRVRIAAEGDIDEEHLVALTDQTSLQSGQEKFLRNCASCHGMHAEGKIGPNLTDRYWIHGGGIKNVFKTIENGVPGKGMINWKMVFTPKEIQQIASYVVSLQGSNPPNAKKPEGNLYVEPKPAVPDSTKTGVHS
jgi:cytochrome c oxidase cbb3-type subunit 3